MEVTLNGTLTPAANAEQEDGENTINLCEASTSSGSASQTMLFDDEFDSEDEVRHFLIPYVSSHELIPRLVT